VNLLVYPNPTLNSITIQGEKWIENAYKVFDQMGREVNSGKLNGIKTEVSLSHLSKGIYILRVEGDFAPIKIIKE
jgi:hypothetical protein